MEDEIPAVSRAQFRFAQGCAHNPEHMTGCPKGASGKKFARDFSVAPPSGYKSLPATIKKASPTGVPKE